MNDGEKLFREFLAEKGITEGDPLVSLLKEFWNRGVELAAGHCGDNEGTDFGATEKFHVS